MKFEHSFPAFGIGDASVVYAFSKISTVLFQEIGRSVSWNGSSSSLHSVHGPRSKCFTKEHTGGVLHEGAQPAPAASSRGCFVIKTKWLRSSLLLSSIYLTF